MDLTCGFYTDHFSHVGLTRLFTKVGPDIYSQPRGDFGRPLNEEEKALLPEDLRSVADTSRAIEGWPSDRPFTATWLNIPSFYPPGDLLLFAPAAAVYEYTDISFTEMNRLLIQLMLMFGHATVFLILLLWRNEKERPLSIAVVLSYLVVIHWSLEGFYDAGWIAPLVLVPWLLRRGDGWAALAAFSAGAFMHFRALIYLPMAAGALVMIVRRKEWKNFDRRKAMLSAVIVLCGIPAAIAFFMVRPEMSSHEMTSAFNPAADAFHPPAVIIAGLVVAVGLTVYWLVQAWDEVVMLVWFAGLVMLLPEVNPWDSVAIVPWLLAPVDTGGKERDGLVKAVRLAVVVLLAVLVFREDFGLDWIRIAMTRL